MLANVALPSFLPHSFATLFGIFLIAAIEGWFIMKVLRLKYGRSYKYALIANLKSTIAGIPFAWLCCVIGLVPVVIGINAMGLQPHSVVEVTLIQTLFFGGVVTNEWSSVGSAVAWIVMLVPFWLGSVWIERRSLIKRLPNYERSQISKAVIRGNLVSYFLFLLLGAYMLSDALVNFPDQKPEQYEERLERARLQKKLKEGR